MKLGIMQPYLFPYIGYFQLINSVNKFIIYDDVQWIKGGWINRNRILVNNQNKLITLSVKKRSSLDKISEFEIDDNPKNRVTFLNQIKSAYKKAPFFQQIFPLIEEIINYKEKNLSKLIINSLQKINSYLEIKTSIYVSSSIKKNNHLKSQDRIINICKTIKADSYINPIGGVSLYNKEAFLLNGINLFFLKTGKIKYQQFNKEFIPNLSIIDVMMFNSKETVSKMLNEFNLL
jgi:hypothetical protein